jgi:hypothetical protein
MVTATPYAPPRVAPVWGPTLEGFVARTWVLGIFLIPAVVGLAAAAVEDNPDKTVVLGALSALFAIPFAIVFTVSLHRHHQRRMTLLRGAVTLGRIERAAWHKRGLARAVRLDYSWHDGVRARQGHVDLDLFALRALSFQPFVGGAVYVVHSDAGQRHEVWGFGDPYGRPWLPR